MARLGPVLTLRAAFAKPVAYGLIILLRGKPIVTNYPDIIGNYIYASIIGIIASFSGYLDEDANIGIIRHRNMDQL